MRQNSRIDRETTARDVGRRGLVLISIEFVLRGLVGLLLLGATQTLPPALFGQLVYLMSLLLLVSVIGDFGLTAYLLRTAGVMQVPRALLARAAGLRLTATLIAIAAAALLLSSREASSDLWTAFAFGSVGILMRAPAELVWSVLRGYGKVGLDARARFLSTVVFALTLGMAVIWGRTLTPFGVAWMAWGIASPLVTAFAMPALTSERPPDYIELMRGAWPFATLALLATIYFRIDQIMLGHLSSDTDAGAYGAAFLAMEAFLIVPVAVTYTLVPAFSSSWARHDEVALESLTKRIRRPLATLGLGLAALGAGAAPIVVPELLGHHYQRTIDVWAVLAWTIPVIYASSAHAALISAGPRPQLNAGIAAFMAVENLLLNLWAIPRFGAVGAAWTTLATEFTGLCINSVAMRRFTVNSDTKVLKAVIVVAAVIALTLTDYRLGIPVGLLILAVGSVDAARLLRGS